MHIIGDRHINTQRESTLKKTSAYIATGNNAE